MTEIYIATEDVLSEAVADRLVLEVHQGLRVAVRMGRKGNGFLKSKLFDLAKTAHAIPVLLLTDLDRTTCPPTLIADWRGRRVFSDDMLFRVVVREIEAWLLADREGFSRFSGIPVDKVPHHPESLDDPKRTLLNLIRRHGNRNIKAEILPQRGSHAAVGFGYNQTLVQFVRESWSAARAAKNASSLDRACRRLRELSLRQQG